MTSTIHTEYVYSSQELSHTYAYMLPQLLSMLPPDQHRETGESVRLLDLGCGNGSLCSLLGTGKQIHYQSL